MSKSTCLQTLTSTSPSAVVFLMKSLGKPSPGDTEEYSDLQEMIPNRRRVCQRLEKAETRTDTVWLPRDVEEKIEKAYHEECVHFIRTNTEVTMCSDQPREKMESFPLTNGDTWITYSGCTLYCRYPRKQAPILQKKNLFLFELHEISTRMISWAGSYLLLPVPLLAVLLVCWWLFG